MAGFLMLLAILAAFISFALFGSAKTSIHEIFAGLSGLVAAVLLTGAAITDAVNRVEKRLKIPETGESGETKSCPECLGFVKKDAKTCRYCRATFEDLPVLDP